MRPTWFDRAKQAAWLLAIAAALWLLNRCPALPTL